MALGKNVDLSDRLIRNTTRNTRKARSAGNARIASNTNITGKPSRSPNTATFSTRKMTFYVKDELLDKLYNYAYWERHSVTEAFNTALADGLANKTTKEKE